MNKNHMIITGVIVAAILVLLACFLITSDESDTYTVTYEREANGQILTETDYFEVGTDAVIATDEIMRDTFGKDIFSHWSPTKNQTTLETYHEGDTIPSGEKGEDIRLYAIHKTPEYKLSYHANGGQGELPADEMIKYGYVGQTATSKLTKEGYRFVEWNTMLNGNGEKYRTNQTFVMSNHDMVLYAMWERIPVAPPIEPEPNMGTAYVTVSANTHPHQYVWTQIYLDGELWREVSFLVDKNKPELGYRPSTNFGSAGTWEFDKDVKEHNVKIVAYCVSSDNNGNNTFFQLVYNETFEPVEFEIINNKIENQTNISWKVTL